MAKRGRPPVLDELKRQQVCAILAVGCSRKVAAKYVGCAADTIRNTALRDPAFHQQLCHAESQYEIVYLQRIQEAAKEGKHWRAAAWVLERRFPDRYGRRRPGTVTVEQITDLLAQFGQILFEEIPDPVDRARALARLSLLTESLQPVEARKELTHQTPPTE
jgi:hypothetical protein